MRSCLLFTALLLAIYFPASAQIDTEFWFAAPEVSALHGDRPVYLVVSSYDEPANITIDQPASGGYFTPVTLQLAPFSSSVITLTDQLPLLENIVSNSVEGKGLHITSTAAISAYYEVYGNNYGGAVNTDIFVLKGRNALGKKFYTPFQNIYPNNSSVQAYSSFDIVATEDHTTITITPTTNITGHAAGVPFSIVLNKGQTWSGKAVMESPEGHPSGTVIESDKPIAVTVKDDSIYLPPNYDLAGDQIIPVNLLGRNYIITNGSGLVPGENMLDYATIVATENNTQIFLNGSSVAIAELAAGQTWTYKVETPSVYITSDKPIYVFHLTGVDNEVAGAILPPVVCTGSKRVSIRKPSAKDFKIILIVKNGAEKYFKLDGHSISFNTGLTSIVPGTNGEWLSIQQMFDGLSPQVHTFSNDSADFHLGVQSGTINATLEYGYFSDFGSIDLGLDKTICKGDRVKLDAGYGKSSYLWSTGERTQKIIARDSGNYVCTITQGNCTLSDTVHIAFYPGITQDIITLKDTNVCAGQGVIFRTDSIFSSYSWNTGSNRRSTSAMTAGAYIVEVKNSYGCPKKDTVYLTLRPLPQINIAYNGDLRSFCSDSTVRLDAGPGFKSYLWSNGDTNQVFIYPHGPEDIYSVTVMGQNNCSNTASVTLDCSIFVEIPNLITANGDGKNDGFFVKGLVLGKWSLQIFNRWGEIVYRNETYDNSWYGEGVSEGIYYYHLKHRDGKTSFKGWVQVVR